MKRIGFGLMLVLAFSLLLGGLRFLGPANSPRQTPMVTMRVLDPSLEIFTNMWQTEVRRRFPDAVVVLVHGGDFVEGQWVVGDWQYRSGVHVRPIQAIVREAQEAFPNRTIVLLACNPGHLKLGIPGVYYAQSSVWCVPDRALDPVTPSMSRMTFNDTVARTTLDFGRWDEQPDVVGNIFEFVAD